MEEKLGLQLKLTSPHVTFFCAFELIPTCQYLFSLKWKCQEKIKPLEKSLEIPHL